MTSTMPDTTIIPVLGYPDIPAAIDWLSEHFGFLERWRVGEHRAQLSLGNGTIAISQLAAKAAALSQSLMVRTDHIASHFERSKAAGLTILQEPTDFPYGERQYSVLDIGGHVWTFTQTIREMAPEDWGGTSARHFS